MHQGPSKTSRALLLIAFAFILVVVCTYSSYCHKSPVRNIEITSHKLLAQKLKCRDKPLIMQRLQHGSYWVIQNLVRGLVTQNIGCADSITYAANGDYTFFETLATLVERWQAPVSFALYAPGYDINGTLESIKYVRNCLPESDLIREFVTFHVFFPAEHMPSYIPFNENAVYRWPYDCSTAPYEEVNTTSLYRKAHNLTYPINVGRNIARKAANTYFVFTSDIELFPSPGLVDRFLQMVERNISLVVNETGKRRKLRVFPLNVYELEENAPLPNSKLVLKAMLDKKQAIRFHSRVCAKCHKFPYEEEWLNLTKVNEMTVLGVAKRQGKFKYWEPFYISDNKEPIFDERVTWEGQKNKRIQGFAMCLMDYEYHILNDGFLVHSPGIKIFDEKSPRLKYVPPMNKLIDGTIKNEYFKLYGSALKNNCSV